ncbi:MAG: hypothetical protein Q8K40_05215 [Ignavibacteria bacterium]|nr:hypothetical protein [Ignavibacteria bacterium]
MKATLRDTVNFDNNCVAPPEMYRRGYISGIASCSYQNLPVSRLNKMARQAQRSQKMADFCVATASA